MKPIVIYAKNDGDNIILNKKDFEEYLRQAYDTGHTDGYAAGRAMNWWSTPITYPTTNPTITWTNEPNKIDPYKITCDAHNDI